jgi:predicted transcriptional regulator
MMARPPKLIIHDEVAMTMADWAKYADLPVSTLRSRLKAGWTMADALIKSARIKKVTTSDTVETAPLMDGTDVVRFILHCDGLSDSKRVNILRELLDEDA